MLLERFTKIKGTNTDNSERKELSTLEKTLHTDYEWYFLKAVVPFGWSASACFIGIGVVQERVGPPNFKAGWGCKEHGSS